MRETFGQLIAPIFIGLLAIGAWAIYPRDCDVPLRYHIGEIDSRFDIATGTVEELLFEAETVWEERSEDELFVYSESEGLPVNFVYDERQQTTNEANQYETTLDNIEGSRENVLENYEDRSANYEEKKASYEAAVARYERELAAYNNRVSTWNDRGGAPEDIHRELTAERNRLGDVQDRLASQRSQLERLRQGLNRLADQGNDLASAYNETATTFNQRFGDSRQFNQATYAGDGITVYQFEAESDLRLALAHEFGHALGIGHVENDRSVMHYLMGGQPMDAPKLTAEDTVAFSAACNIDVTN